MQEAEVEKITLDLCVSRSGEAESCGGFTRAPPCQTQRLSSMAGDQQGGPTGYGETPCDFTVLYSVCNALLCLLWP
jgi:hypothetical protein